MQITMIQESRLSQRPAIVMSQYVVKGIKLVSNLCSKPTNTEKVIFTHEMSVKIDQWERTSILYCALVAF